MTGESKGLTKAMEIYQDRSRRAKELKAGGKRIIGYNCIYAPLEMIAALDLEPYGLFGDMKEPASKADRGLPAAFCHIMRSLLDLGLKGRYDFLDGVVMPHACDAIEKTAHVWQGMVPGHYFHFMDVPCALHEESLEYFKGQMVNLKKTLESLAGKELSAEKLRRVIEAYNEQRALVRELYDLRKPDPPLISGTENLQVIKALMSIPVEEGNKLLREVISEVKERKNGPQKKAARLLVWSHILDDVALMETIEDAGASVVIDDCCVGRRAYQADVAITKDPLDGLADYYLTKITCARTFREAVFGETKKDRIADLESRFGFMKDYVAEWNVNGAILLLVRYCDPFGFEVTEVTDYFNNLSIPNTYLEHDYSEAALAPLRTRVQAFLEVIS